MKLSIDDLRVDSYAVQLSETELTEVKGGTTLPCVGTFVKDVVVPVVVAIINQPPSPAAIKVEDQRTYGVKLGNGATADSTRTITTTIIYK